MNSPERATLTVYIRSGCHLCEDLLLQLQQLRQVHPFDFITVDVDSDARLKELYGVLVPVVMHGDVQICHYFLDQAALLQAIGSTIN